MLSEVYMAIVVPMVVLVAAGLALCRVEVVLCCLGWLLLICLCRVVAGELWWLLGRGGLGRVVCGPARLARVGEVASAGLRVGCCVGCC